MSTAPKWRRLLIKVSGEALAGDSGAGLHAPSAMNLAHAIADLHQQGTQIALVVGGGNFFRGKRSYHDSLPRVTADQIGMLATMMNGLALKEALIAAGVQATVMSSIECPRIAPLFHWKQASEALDKGEVVICVGGTGNPYFTTDTTAALRACEIGADLLVKATQVDGVYDRDPRQDPKASRYRTLTASDALEQNLQVMDATAFALCMENDLPILVCNIFGEHSLSQIVSNTELGTLVTAR